MRRIKQSSIHGVYCISRYLYQCYSNQLFFFFFFFFFGGGGGGGVSIAQLVEVTDSSMLGGVVEVVSSIPMVGHKNIFQHLPAYLIYYISPYKSSL